MSATFLFAAMAFAVPGQAKAQTWRFAEQKDAMTDRMSWSLIAVPQSPAPEGAHFKIECFGTDASTGDPNVSTMIEWGVPIYPLYPDGDGVHAMAVTARFGDGEPVTLGFSTSQTYTLAWQPNAGQKMLGGIGEIFMAPLRGKSVNFNWTPLQLYVSATADSPLIFRATAVNGNAVTLTFREDGLMAALRRMPESCLPDGYKEALTGSSESTGAGHSSQAQAGSTTTSALNLFAADGWTDLSEFDTSLLPAEAFVGRAVGDRTHVEGRRFAFMKDRTAILRVMDPDWRAIQLFFLFDEEENIWWLDGTSAPIYQYLAKHAPILDTELQARHLLYFNLFFIQGAKGPFAIVESVDDYLFPSSMRTDFPEITAKIKAHLKPSRCTGDSAEWTCTGSVYYSNAVFDAVVELDAAGTPKMTDDIVVFADLPVKIAMPIH